MANRAPNNKQISIHFKFLTGFAGVHKLEFKIYFLLFDNYYKARR